MTLVKPDLPSPFVAASSGLAAAPSPLCEQAPGMPGPVEMFAKDNRLPGALPGIPDGPPEGGALVKAPGRR